MKVSRDFHNRSRTSKKEMQYWVSSGKKPQIEVPRKYASMSMAELGTLYRSVK